MTNPHKIGIVLALLAIALLVAWCNRQPEQSEPSQPEKVLNRELLTDSIKSKIEAQYRARETKAIQAYSDSLAQIRAKLPKSKDKAAKSVKQYQNAPNLANCDTAIADLQTHAAALETGLAIADTIMKRQSNVIGSFAGTVQRKDSTIAAVSDVARNVIGENAVLQKKVKKQSKVIKILIGALTVVGVFIGGMAASK